ncbi:MAG TPA: permease [Actinomycetota bacterium]|nr:permease [Actinomycetota bacterium]
MAEVAQPLPRGTGSRAPLLAVLGGLAGLALLLQVADPSRVPAAQNFVLVFSSLLIEAVPFILLGALVSAFIEVFVPGRVFEKLTLLPRPLQLPASAMAGMAFPVCECGSVPVARRLAAKGLAPGAAITFMLAAPILNPIVLASTFVAYRGRDIVWPMLLGRAGLGLLAAVAVGWVIGGRTKTEVLRARPEDVVAHAHPHEGPRHKAFFDHLSGDFVFMARYLVFGAAVAAALQTFVPQSVIGSVAGAPVISLLAMMGLAFLLSLCSESDAFVAASFVQFGVGAQLAFLVFGPMVDTKLGFLYTATFSKGFFRTVVVTVMGVTLVGCLWIEVLIG